MYRILERDSVADYLRSIPAVDTVLGSGDLDIDEVGDGNLNFVYKVRNSQDPTRSVVLKQAVPYLRMVGEEWPLSRDRMTYEIRALQLYNELVPDFVPTIHHADEAMSTLVMECLDDHIILRLGTIDGVRYPHIADHIGEFLAQTLFRTSAFALESQERRRLMDRFTLNSELCQLTEEFIFTFPYMEHDSNWTSPITEAWARENLRNDTAYKLDVLAFKELFLAKTDALLHADLHTGSVMVNQEESYVIDMEFAYFGPFGFDIGKIMANFWMAATSHIHRSEGTEYRDWLIEQAFAVWTRFSTRFVELWSDAGESAMLTKGLLQVDEFDVYRDRFMSRLLRESMGFAACSLARRTLGIAGVADIRDVENPELRAQLEIINLELSKLLMANHRTLDDIGQVSELVHGFYADRPSDL